MTKGKHEWKKAIVKALMQKGFTRKGSKKTAVMTMKRSIECLRINNVPRNFTVKMVVIDGIEREVKVYPPAR